MQFPLVNFSIFATLHNQNKYADAKIQSGMCIYDKTNKQEKVVEVLVIVQMLLLDLNVELILVQ